MQQKLEKADMKLWIKDNWGLLGIATITGIVWLTVIGISVYKIMGGG